MVDEIGNLDDAVAAAAALAETTDYKRVNYPNFTKDFKEVFKDIPFISLKESLKTEFGADNIQLYEQLKSITQLNGIQARMPFVMMIK